mgnify:CR=1 FL=1
MGVSVEQCREHHGAVAMAGTLTIKNANKDSRARIEYVCGKSKSSGTKKKLNYNYKEVSNQLLRAKKPQGAANALTKAKSRLATCSGMPQRENTTARKYLQQLHMQDGW